MCGIAGVVGNGSLQLVQSMLAIQAHRGPDNTSVWQQEKIVLGHNRLSILDLSESANQPMHSSGHRYYIVFNGEIYNYKELQQQYLASEKLHTRSPVSTV
jgi:asparagine synthase (glutamine-hydrolysing)